jgi:hypothetical protein
MWRHLQDGSRSSTASSHRARPRLHSALLTEYVYCSQALFTFTLWFHVFSSFAQGDDCLAVLKRLPTITYVISLIIRVARLLGIVRACWVLRNKFFTGFFSCRRMCSPGMPRTHSCTRSCAGGSLRRGLVLAHITTEFRSILTILMPF